MRRSLALAVVLAVWIPLSGCDDDTQDSVRDSLEDAGEEVRDVAGQAGARAAAEAMRAALIARDLDDDQTVRDVDVLEDAADDVPGDPEVRGIEDTTGDGRDDDGNVEIEVDGEVACVTVQDNGDVDVSGGAC